MKTLFYKLLILVSLHNLIMTSAQETQLNTRAISSDEVYKSMQEMKSGNWKDVMTDFMQAAVKDLTGDKKSFQYKASIFSIKSKADSTLLTDYNYTKETFSRNFQVAIGLNLDNDYKFTGFEYGFDWAIINKRDLSVAKPAQNLQKMFQDSNLLLIEKLQLYKEKINDSKEFLRVKKIIDDALDKGEYIPRENLPEEFLSLLPDSYNDTSVRFEKEFNEEIEKIKMRPLLTLGFRSNFRKDAKFLDEFNADLVYLQGLKSKNNSKLEIDFRNRFSAKDSMTTSIIKRKEFSSQLGLNISVLKKGNKSLIEFKPNFEFKRVISGLMDEEKNNQFLANADLRLRVLKNLWIPLVLKYDIENNNLFGFLNVSFNFEAIKND
ncbi:hypothetical protein OK18_10245 [Chryseobacterium gallinarum]|uniref:DUF3078 domain-containing protein n=1 Tax=Chryseobacterium gallinarum TaxID=1324352 RepID=A0A0G3M2U5_CHRGL|nr:hypothetical protein [Chryseobacterium gallinarum]AKK72950.1 hypothetical protein OK18_10245 [Chryseobacterium gallinarum]